MCVFAYKCSCVLHMCTVVHVHACIPAVLLPKQHTNVVVTNDCGMVPGNQEGLDRPRSISQPAFEKSALPKWHLSELAPHLWGVDVGGLEVENASKACHRLRHLACHRMRHRLAKVRFRAESVRCRAPELFCASAVAMFHGQRDFVQLRKAQVKIQLKPKLFLVIGTLLSTLPQGFRHHGWFVRSWPCLCSKMFLIRVCGVSVLCLVCLVCLVCVVCVVQMMKNAPCLARVAPEMSPNWVAEHLGASSRRPRHPFPTLMVGEPWPCTCVHGPKKTQRLRRHLLLSNNRHANHNRDIDHLVNVLQIRRAAATVGNRLSSHRPHLWNMQACTPRPSDNGCNYEITTDYPRLHL